MNRKRRGELSELAFIYKATGLGFNVSKPYGDSSRYDFIVEHGGCLSKVQVKSTSQLFPTGGYYLNCQRRMKGGTFPYLPGEVDFFAAHVVPLDTWYIIPLTVIGSKYYVRFFPHQPARDLRFAPYREAWPLLESSQVCHPDPERSEGEGPAVSDHPMTRSPDHPIPGFLLTIDACADGPGAPSKPSFGLGGGFHPRSSALGSV